MKKSILKKHPDSKLARFIDRNIYIILAFICSAVLMLLVYYCFEIIPFGNKTVLRMDLYHQYGPLFAELYDRITQLKSMLYSWNTGGGGAFIGNYYNYLSSPVGGLLVLLFGHENVPEAIGSMVLLKNALAAAAMAYYLKKTNGRNDFTVSAFGILYAFCGFFIAYYWNIMWIDAMYLLPLVVLGIERIIKKQKATFYIVALAVSFFSNYYMSYMICIFSVLYFLVYFFSNYSIKEVLPTKPIYEDENGEIYERKIDNVLYSRFVESGLLFTLGSFVAVGLAAVALLPTYFCLKTCSATSGTFPSDYEFYNSIFDFLANHLASLEPTIRSSGDTVLPNVYCGVITVMLVPLYIFCDKIKAKERAAHIILLAVFFLGFNLNFANYIVHAFHFPNDLPFRFSFIYSFLLLTIAYKALVNIRSFSTKALLGSGVATILFAVLVQKLGMSNASEETIYLSIAFAAVYTVVLGLMKKKNFAQSAVSLLLMCCVFAEVAVCDTNHFVISQQKPNFVNGYSDFRELKDKLDTVEGTDKYRMELTDINTLMDASWFNYNGVSVFSSMAYEKSANLQHNLGLNSNYINSYIYDPQTPVYNAMMSLKYLVNNDESLMNEQLFTEVAGNDSFTAYKNNYYLPIAYCVSDEVEKWITTGTNPFDIQNDYWTRATDAGDVFEKIPAASAQTDNIRDGEELLTENFTYYKDLADQTGTIIIKYEIPEAQNVYLYADCTSADQIEVYGTNGLSKSQDPDDPYILDCGYFEQGEIMTVEIAIPANKESGYADIYAVGLNMDNFEYGYNKLAEASMDITEFEDTYIKGTVTVSANELVYTSVNYDEGWEILVDGEKVEPVAIGGALIGIDAAPGTHTIEMKYKPKGLLIGGIISAGTLVIFIAVLVILHISKKKRFAKYAEVQSGDGFISAPTVEPTGIDALMAQDLGEDATIEDAEKLLDVPDEYELNKKDPTETLNRADEILNTQKINLKEILSQIENNDDSEDEV
ncbi:MAG: YfhO family protein [Acutalibacteraceae bacterium]